MAVTFSGLASGLDTTSLINQLVAAERAPVNVIAQKQSDLNTQKSIVSSLSSSVAALGTAVHAMTLPSDLQPRTAAASDSHVTVAASSGAAATVHDVRVQQLARGQISASRTFASQTAGVVGDGTLTIAAGTTSKQISYSSTDTLATIASKINDANAGATASVLFDGKNYRLMLASTQTGKANAPTFTETGDGLGMAAQVDAQDAMVTIDGVKDITRSSNVIDDAISGITLTLNSKQADTDPDTAVTVSQDNTALTSKLSAFVSAYNQINASLHVQLDYNGQTKGTNTLFGDSTLRQLQNALGGVMSGAYGGNAIDSLGLVRDKSGNLTLDTSKLNTALAANPSALSDLFISGGLSSAVSKLSTTYSGAGGMFSAKSDSLTSRFTTLQKQADQINIRADALKTTLQNQFNSLETMMQTLKSQSSYLTSVLG
jgi:flagellar hook-associated protein 2